MHLPFRQIEIERRAGVAPRFEQQFPAGPERIERGLQFGDRLPKRRLAVPPSMITCASS